MIKEFIKKLIYILFLFLLFCLGVYTAYWITLGVRMLYWYIIDHWDHWF